MSMSKKDYVAVANIISNARANTSEGDKVAREAITYIASDLAREFAKGNKLFDSGKFLRACGLVF